MVFLSGQFNSIFWQILFTGRFNETRFVDAGECSRHTRVHGFMQRTFQPARDVWKTSCTGGWTAGNLVAPVSDVARFTYDVYSPNSPQPILGPASRSLMTNFSAPGGSFFKFYGMGTFNLGWVAGKDADGRPIDAVGHVGDTYGINIYGCIYIYIYMYLFIYVYIYIYGPLTLSATWATRTEYIYLFV